ncbi:MAG: UDP-N-acetylmuramate--L-alanine ligase [Acidimicrobiaceae bacterium]|nr:UDP-N-acetylmuramate--L-alanine ligase [Acidimicrobiaceae bacterium]
MTPDLSEAHHIHLVGAGGAGMGAIADVLHRMGHTVTGSDLKDGPVAERLRVAGMEIHVGHAAANVGAADLVAISTAIPEHNPEVRAANERQIPVLRRSDILPAISAERRSIVVAGTHGKTTTSSMLAMAMMEADLDPSFIIGGDVNEIGSGAVWADGEWFIIEGDESDRTFLSLGAEVAIVTNVEPDHLETYDNDPEQLMAAFVQFADAATTPIYCADDPGAMQIASAVPGITYGTAEHADYRIVDMETDRASVAFTIRHDGVEVARVELPTPGMHNARNAAAALVATIAAGGSAAAAAMALARFGGVARRFEFRGEIDGVTFVDDYAHLPTEVEAALAAATDGGWERIVCVFQPHRYSRTAALWQDFAHGFGGADVLVVTDIYASGETPRPGITGKLIVDAVLDAHPWSTVAWMPRLDDAAGWLAQRLRPGDLCLTLGAGDLTGLPGQVIGRLEHKGAA